MMKSYQERIVSFGNKLGKSRWFIVLAVLIAITYFASFMSAAIRITQDLTKLTPLYLFNAFGFLAFGLGVSYGAYMLIKSKSLKSRGSFLLIFLALAWGSFSSLMKIYPWNSVIAVAVVAYGVLISRKYEWTR